MKERGETRPAMPVGNDEESLVMTDVQKVKSPGVLTMTIQEMKKMPSVMYMFEVMSLTPRVCFMMEKAVADVVAQCGGAHAFFANNNAVKDCATEVELLG